MRLFFILLVFSSITVQAQISFTEHTIIGGDFRVNSPVDVVAGDIDGDGDADLASIGQGNGYVFFHENDGNGYFTTHLVFNAIQGPNSVVLMNYGSGYKKDIVVAALQEGKIYLILNQSDQVNQNWVPWIIAENLNGPYDLAIADLDNDGDEDILSVSAYDNKVFWLENTNVNYPGPTFLYHLIMDSLSQPRAIDGNDIDGDNDVDIAIAFFNADKIVLLENNGNQNFTYHLIDDAANGANNVRIADIYNDGDMDIVATTEYGKEVIFYNYYNDRFNKTLIGSGYRPKALKIGDVDGDRFNDVMVAFDDVDKVSSYNYDSYHLGKPFYYVEINNTTDAPYAVDVADFDGDGDNDVVSTALFNDAVVWYKNEGNYPFAVRDVFSIASSAKSVFAADVDGDGDMDVLSASGRDNKIAWYENMLNGHKFRSHIVNDIVKNAHGVAAADIENDGDMDIVGISFSEHKTWIHENDGNQNFYNYIYNPYGLFQGGPFAIKFRDRDGNQYIDMVVAKYYASELRWLLDIGRVKTAEAYYEIVVTSKANNARGVDAADMDHDGDMDVLGACRDKIAWYENQQNYPPYPEHQEHIITTAVSNAWDVEAVDLDEDGDWDVIGTSEGNDKVAWYENDGNLNFTEHILPFTGKDPHRLHTVDIDADGDKDILCISADKLVCFINDGSLNFSELLVANTHLGTSVFSADIDGDGDLDILTASESDDRIAWYEQTNSVPVEDAEAITSEFTLFQNFPNPFNAFTKIKFSLAENSKVILEIVDQNGKKVKTLLNRNMSRGEYHLNWNGRNDSGQAVSSGVYFYRLKAGKQQKVRKLIFIK